MNRRHFLTLMPASLTVPAFALDADNPYRNEIGLQLYTLRKPVAEDLAGTLKAVTDAGYKQVETYGFPDAAVEPIRIARDLGLQVHSSHFAWESVTEPDKPGVPAFDGILEQAKEAGLTHLVIPYLHGRNRETLDDYKRVVERCNGAAVKAKEVGIQLAYHNHNFEFEILEGERSGYDVMIEEFVPEMQFEVDVFWVKAGGWEPVDLIEKLSGRVSQLHLKDLKKGLELPNFGKLPNDAFEELGDGMIPMEPIIEAAGEAGVAHCHVEQDQSPDPVASVRQSLDHLRTL